MPSFDDIHERAHVLWDELADFDASQADEALRHLMAGLCGLVDAQNAVWIGAVRLAGNFPGDPVKGWRPRIVRYMRPAPPILNAVKEQTLKLETGSVDDSTVRNVAGAGSFRVNRLADLVPGEWFDAPYYRRYYREVGNNDTIWAGIPINEDAESYVGIHRDLEHPFFTPDERDLVGYALRGLKWFFRRQMLSHGLTVASTPLTATEREVLGGLLTGLSEKQIAASRRQSAHTTHEYVTNIYRQFDVKNRAALMALWLGKA